MPGFDNTGPTGTGPIGRGMGPCGGGQTGWGRGRGFRRGGFGWGFLPSTNSTADEKGLLEQQKGWLESQIDVINKRLQGMDNE